MAQINCPVPIRTPLFDGSGPSLFDGSVTNSSDLVAALHGLKGSDLVAALGNFNRAWISYFRYLDSEGTGVGTNAQRLKLAPPPEGTLYVESDTNQIWQSRVIAGKLAWVYVTGGSGGGGGAGGYSSITVTGGHATPDLSMATNLEVLVTAPTAIDAPIHVTGPGRWTLILVQDPTGDWPVTFDPLGYVNAAGLALMLILAKNTESKLTFIIRPDGLSDLSGFMTGWPIL